MAFVDVEITLCHFSARVEARVRERARKMRQADAPFMPISIVIFMPIRFSPIPARQALFDITRHGYIRLMPHTMLTLMTGHFDDAAPYERGVFDFAGH